MYFNYYCRYYFKNRNVYVRTLLVYLFGQIPLLISKISYMPSFVKPKSYFNTDFKSEDGGEEVVELFEYLLVGIYL